jgi:hypothetical protein
MKKLILSAIVFVVLAVGGAVAYSTQMNKPVEFYNGHSHDHDMAVIGDAPQHSGGLDRNGCHNASVPYHCH